MSRVVRVGLRPRSAARQLTAQDATLGPRTSCLYSSVAERQSCKLKVLGSIPSGGFDVSRFAERQRSCKSAAHVPRNARSRWRRALPLTYAIVLLRERVARRQRCRPPHSLARRAPSYRKRAVHGGGWPFEAKRARRARTTTQMPLEMLASAEACARICCHCLALGYFGGRLRARSRQGQPKLGNSPL